MNKKMLSFCTVLMLISLMFMTLCVFVPEPVAGTIVSGEVGDQTWTRAGSPYVVTGDIWISAGKKLVIEPWVNVTFTAGQNYNLVVNGILDARGTATQHITFSATNPPVGAGDWENIVFTSTSRYSNLSYVDIEGSGRGTAKITIDIDNTNVSIENVTIRLFANSNNDRPMRLTNSYSLIKNVTINNSNNRDDAGGIIVDGGAPSFQNVEIRLTNSNRIIFDATSTCIIADKLRLSRNTDVDGTALKLSNSPNSTLTNITVRAGGSGITLSSSSGVKLSNAVIVTNTIGAGASGLVVDGVSGATNISLQNVRIWVNDTVGQMPTGARFNLVNNSLQYWPPHASPQIRDLHISVSSTSAEVRGIDAINSRFILENSSIFATTSGVNRNFQLNTDSHIITLNTSFDKTKTNYADALSNLTVMWYLNTQVNRSLRWPNWDNTTPVAGAIIWTNFTGAGAFARCSPDSPGITDASGWRNWTRVVEYVESQNGRLWFADQNVTAWKSGYSRVWNNTVNITGVEEVTGVIKRIYLLLRENISPNSTLSVIPPYWRRQALFIFSRFNATDPQSSVAFLVLWYRHSLNNNSWPWSWNVSVVSQNSPPYPDPFTGPISFTNMTNEGEGYYELYSQAVDRADNREPVPVGSVAKTRFAYDITAPNSMAAQISYWQNSAPITVPVTGSDNFYVGRFELWAQYRADNSSAWSSWQKVADYQLSPPSPSFTQNIAWSPSHEGYYRYASVAIDLAANTELLPGAADGEFCYRVPAKLRLSGPMSMIADTQVTFTVEVQNSTNQPVTLSSPLVVSLETSSPKGFFRETGTMTNITTVTVPKYGSSASFDYNDTMAGTWMLNVSATGVARDQTAITVNPGKIDHIIVTPASWTMTADDTKLFTATAYDKHNNPVNTTFSWEVTNGTMNPSSGVASTYYPWSTGTWIIYANVSGISGCAVVTVLNGTLDYILVMPAVWTMTADDTKQFTATAYDGHGNIVSATFSWQATNGTVVNGLFTPWRTGRWTIYANTSGKSGTAIVTVQPGTLARIIVMPSSAALIAGSQQQFSAEGYDGKNNTISGLTFAWSATIGTVSATGLFTAPITAGLRGWVNASKAAVTGSATVIIIPDALDHIHVSPSTVNVVAGKTQSFTAVGHDRYDNVIPGVRFIWTTNVGTMLGNVLTAQTTAGIRGYVRAANGTIIADATVTIIPDKVARIEVIPSYWYMQVSTTKQFSAKAYDRFDNQIVGTVFTWSATAGTINSTGYFIAPPTPMTVYVNATNSTVTGSAKVVVTFEPLPGAIVSGVVLNGTSGLGIENANVSAYDAESDRLKAWTISNSNGEYRLPPLYPAGNYYLYAHKPGYRSSLRVNLTLNYGEHRNVNFILYPLIGAGINGSFSGTVYSLNYQPLAGAKIIVYNRTDAAVRTVYTDTNGTYSVLNLVADSYRVVASYPGYRAETKFVTVCAGLDIPNVDFVLSPLPDWLQGSVSGTVKDEVGNAIDNATVVLKNERKTIVNITLTNRSGWFNISGLAPGNYTLEVSREGYENYSMQLSITLSALHRRVEVILTAKRASTDKLMSLVPWIIMLAVLGFLLLILFMVFSHRRAKRKEKTDVEEKKTLVLTEGKVPIETDTLVAAELPERKGLFRRHKKTITQQAISVPEKPAVFEQPTQHFIAPSPLRATVVDDGTAVKLEWEAIYSDELYRIYHSRDGKTFEKLAELQRGSISYKHENLHWGEIHYYRLGIVDSEGRESSQQRPIRIIVQPPPPPPKTETVQKPEEIQPKPLSMRKKPRLIRKKTEKKGEELQPNPQNLKQF